MVGIAIFMAVLFFGVRDRIAFEDIVIRVLPAVVLGAVFARPLGAIVQRFVTTKRPTDRQLANAISAGESLLKANATAQFTTPTPLRRIWCMGLLQVVAGAFATTALVAALKLLTHAEWLPDVSR